jgi:molybdate transport system regulatory protein
MTQKKIKPAFKIWFEIGESYVFGEGAYELLEQIREKKSISAAAKTTHMSYRYAWALIKEVEEHLGEPVVKAQKGGKSGGKTEITNAGLSLIANYKKLMQTIAKACRIESEPIGKMRNHDE